MTEQILPGLSTATADIPKADGSDTGATGTDAAAKAAADKAAADTAAASEGAGADDAAAKATADAAAKEAAGKATPTVPEKYEFKVPDDVKLDPAAMEKVTGAFKKAGLTQEQAQALMDLNLEMSKGKEDAFVAEFEKQKKAWQEETTKELGADAPQRMAMAAKARDVFGSPELTQILKDSGLEYNIHVIKYFEGIGKRISEDTLGEGKAGGGKDLSKLSPHEKMEHHIQADMDAQAKTKK